MEAGYSQNLTLLVEDHFEQGCTPERFRGNNLYSFQLGYEYIQKLIVNRARRKTQVE